MSHEAQRLTWRCGPIQVEIILHSHDLSHGCGAFLSRVKSKYVLSASDLPAKVK